MAIIQDGRYPYETMCSVCREVWLPKPVTRGPTKGQHTESSLDKSANDHFKVCKGAPK